MSYCFLHILCIFYQQKQTFIFFAYCCEMETDTAVIYGLEFQVRFVSILISIFVITCNDILTFDAIFKC